MSLADDDASSKTPIFWPLPSAPSASRALIP